MIYQDGPAALIRCGLPYELAIGFALTLAMSNSSPVYPSPSSPSRPGLLARAPGGLPLGWAPPRDRRRGYASLFIGRWRDSLKVSWGQKCRTFP